MPMIDFYFNGWIRGATISEAFDPEGNKVDVSKLTVYELATALNKGELTIELAPFLSDHVECKIDTQDFTASRFRPRDKDG